ncbi:hypothetical protein L2E82_30035 [Cichorium intybus]|uniref:Uncharacterized protein n=1 Tax=Cichorium intybus TaxID=13427 RepID=A0ACB9CZL3_CICIN|nr:hypothetical protein L2E82_30035 [Cichorium intybus]
MSPLLVLFLFLVHPILLLRSGAFLNELKSRDIKALTHIYAFPPASFSAFVSVDNFSIIAASDTLCKGS